MYTIQGIQHLGVGVPNHEQAWKWYRKFFGLDIPLFNDEAEAPLMTIYTEGDVISKRAAMVLNIKGGCAIEIVCPSTFEASHAKVDHQLGDLGIDIGFVKAPDIQKAYDFFKENGAEVVSGIVVLPNGWKSFYVKDLNGLVYQVLPANDFYTNHNHATGGTTGCSVGVSNMDKAMSFYGLLGYDEVVFDEKGIFEDWKNISGGTGKFRRVLLTQKKSFRWWFF
jgi:hypothetical protein